MSGTGWLWSISSEAQAARWPPGVGFKQDLVADDVQLLLRFTLHVAGTGIAEHATEGALADGDGDAGAGAGHHGDQLAQVGIDAAGVLFWIRKRVNEVRDMGGQVSAAGKRLLSPVWRGRA